MNNNSNLQNTIASVNLNIRLRSAEKALSAATDAAEKGSADMKAATNRSEYQTAIRNRDEANRQIKRLDDQIVSIFEEIDALYLTQEVNAMAASA